jgi:hypothetical protein
VPYAQIERKEGEHIVRGKKNYLPPAMLVLGYGILWTTEDEETMERHERPLITESADADVDVASGDTGPTEDLDINDEPSATLEDANADDSSESDGEASNVATDNKAEEKDKYNLDQYGSASEDDVATPEPQPTVSKTSTKRHLSAKQRRDLKKGKSMEAEDESDTSEVEDVTSSITSMTLSKSKPPPKVRGKKAKLKKMKARYADQSDEERELARKLLGTKNSIPTSQEIGGSGSPGEAGTALQPTKKTPPSQPPRPPKPVVDEPLEV